MKRVLTAVVLIPLVLLLIFKAPTWGIGIVVALVGFFSVREYLQLVEKYGLGVLKRLTWIIWVVWSGALIGLPLTQYSSVVLPAWMFLAFLPAFLVYLIVSMRQKELAQSFPVAGLSFAALPYIFLPLGMVVALHQTPARQDGWFLLVYLLLVVWGGDIAGLYVGRSIGKHQLAPRLSPKKTWEGTVGSLLGSILVGTLWFSFSAEITDALSRSGIVSGNIYVYVVPYHIITGVLLSAAVNIFAQLGDLAESLLKRGAGVKDSGSILPGHGGMLDRIDALLFAAPVVWYYALFLLLPPRA